MNQRDSTRRKSRTSRRQFLSRAAGVATSAAIMAKGSTASASSVRDPLLPTIRLGKHEVTRLVIGGNPIYGHSHFNRLYSEHMKAWHTPERVVELIKHCEARGINTWQNSYTDRTMSDLDRYRESGGKINWLCLGKPDWDEKPEFIKEAVKRKPIGIAPHGALADRLFRLNKLSELNDLLKRIRDTGVPVGMSAHNPELIATAESKGWDIDYYMCCLYYLTRPKEEYAKLVGEDLPLGEIYLPGDPPRMFKMIQGTRKTCFAYKILAAGRKTDSASQVRSAFETAFKNIKPTDAVIVGMYQQFSDQVADNAAMVRSICAAA